MTLASELFDEKHPPPPTIAVFQGPTKGPELFWETKPGLASIPFCLNLPLNLGPPPYQSKQARIRYVLLPTLVLKDGGKRKVVSQLCNIHILTVFDPQKALTSLPNPLTVTETIKLAGVPGPQCVKLTAGLHRQIWVNGSSIFVDVHIANRSTRILRKVDIQLQKTTLWYTYAAAGTDEKNANHLRIPKRQESDIVAVASVKKSKEWKGVLPNASELRTYQIHVPREHVTISTGRFFEVRYLLNVIVSISMFKMVRVQAPVTIIHMNSLDIMPNASAQVAASIEAKRSRSLPLDSDHARYRPCYQGQAFIAPQKQSLELQRQRQETSTSSVMEGLKRDVDRSPRKHKVRRQRHHHCYKSVASQVTKDDEPHIRPSFSRSPHCHARHDPDCYHCCLHNIEHDRRPSTSQSRTGPKLPRLQVSTSGLDFTESEFSVPDSPPKKVMLSEQERKMINQQRELQARKEYTEMKRQRSTAKMNSTSRPRHPGMQPVLTVPRQGQRPTRGAGRHAVNRQDLSRARSKTLDQSLGSSMNPNVQRPPLSNQKRANTSPNELYDKIVVQRERPGMVRMSSKKRGKLPAEEGFLRNRSKIARQSIGHMRESDEMLMR